MVTSSRRTITPQEREAIPDLLRERTVMRFKEMVALAGCATGFVTIAYGIGAALVALIGGVFGMPRRVQGLVVLSILAVLAAMVLLSLTLMQRRHTRQSRRFRERMDRYTGATEVLETEWSGRYWFGLVTLDEEEAEEHFEEDEETVYDDSERVLLVSPGATGEDWIVVRCGFREGPKRLTADGRIVTTTDSFLILEHEQAGEATAPEDLSFDSTDAESDVERYLFTPGPDAPIVEVLPESEVQPDLRDAVIARLEADVPEDAPPPEEV